MAKINYPIRPAGKLLLGMIDTLLRPLSRTSAINRPKRILIAQPAHLGDVVLATALIAPLKEAGFEIGAAIGSWAQEAIAPQVTWTHTVDHWKLNRAKHKSYFKSRRQALQEIRSVGYDVSLDLRFHFPNLAPLMWQAGIPVRIGFTSAGFSPLLTHPLPWKERDAYALAAYASLLHPLITCENLSPSLPHTQAPREDFLILHLGSGDLRKEWPLSHWQALAGELTSPLVFTGRGERQRQAIETIGKGENLCDRLTWQELIDTVAKARAVITVDTAMAHIAAALNTPAIVLYREKISSVWKPPGAHALNRFSIEEILNTLRSF